MATPVGTAMKIASALNELYHCHCVINTQSFFGREGKAVRMYIVKDSYNYGGEHCDKELFRSASGIYTCLFMRDLLYTMQGKKIVEETNEGYIRVREKRNADAAIEYMRMKYEPTDIGS